MTVPRHRASRRALAAGLAAAGLTLGSVLAAPVATSMAAHADTFVGITITGSTQMQTLGQLLAKQYQNLHPNVHITVNATSSADGFSETCGNNTQLGMSDNYIQDDQLRSPNCGDMVGIPVAVSATTLVYNLPGAAFNQRSSGDNFTLVHPLRFDAKTVADIYMGNVTTWNDPEIKRLNPGVKLPDQTIQVYNSAEPGGAGFVFNQWLAQSVPMWNSTVGVTIQPLWPRGHSVGQPTAGAMVQAIQSTPYSMGFAGFDFAISNHMQAAALKNAAGVYQTPLLNGVSHAIGKALKKGFASDFRTPFVTIADPDAFNPACLEFFVVHSNLKVANPSAAAASANQATKAFLQWAISSSGGQAYIEAIEFRKYGKANKSELAHGFVPVPDALRLTIQSKVDGINA